ncbi:MAG TPA: hypothetical protein PKY88_12885 [Anaerohalosphaeraceae bacterium]|nr:hypothetical protein [Anaerohalosphaeraceae bacterium]
MNGFVKTKQLFFDRQAVTSALDKSTRKVLSKFGGLVRKTARWSIRKRKRASAPGSPPSSHTELLKRFIFYSYDDSEKSVVIGPAKLHAKKGSAPEVLEYGGTILLEIGEVKKQIQIARRPYMNPAFEKTKTQLPHLWRNSIIR